MPSTPQNDTKSWAVTLEQDPETGELLLPFPVDLLNQMGWSEGTDIFWDVQDNGSIIIREKKPQNSLRRRSLAELNDVLDEIVARNPVEMKQLEDYIEEQIRKANDDRISSRS